METWVGRRKTEKRFNKGKKTKKKKKKKKEWLSSFLEGN